MQKCINNDEILIGYWIVSSYVSTSIEFYLLFLQNDGRLNILTSFVFLYILTA